MDWNWFWGLLQGFFGSALYDLLLAGVVAALLAYLKAKKERLTGPVAYGVAGFTMVMIIAYTLAGHAIAFTQQPQTTPENIEANVKAWADDLGLGVQTQSDPAATFLLRIVLHNGRVVAIGQPKERPKYIQYQAQVAMDADGQAFFAKLPPDQAEQIVDEVDLELARSGMGYEFVNTPIIGVILKKVVLISNSFTEETLTSDLEQMDSAVAIAREAIRLAISNTKFSHPPPHSK
jgi:hypothetical protein